MPTKKPVIQVVLEEETFAKLKTMCEKEKRSTSNMCSIIIEDYVKMKETERIFDEMIKSATKKYPHGTNTKSKEKIPTKVNELKQA